MSESVKAPHRGGGGQKCLVRLGLGQHSNYPQYSPWIRFHEVQAFEKGLDNSQRPYMEDLLIKLLCILGELSIAMLIIYFAYELVDLGKQYFDRDKRGF